MFRSLARRDLQPEVMDRPDLAKDERFAEYRPRESHYFDLAPLIERQFATNTYHHWEWALIAHDVPFTAVNSISDYLRNEQVEHLELIDWQDDGLALVRAPWQFDGIRPERSGRAPRVGADSREVAAEVVPVEQIDELIASGILFADGA